MKSAKTEGPGKLIREDRIAQGLSLQGLADKLNADRSLELDRAVTTSWLHHLENDRTKPLTPHFKKGLARALGQDENRYLSGDEGFQKRASSFARFFDEQIHDFEQNSTLICDLRTDFSRTRDLSDLLVCVYQFLTATDGKLVAFERSHHIVLPVFLTAIKAWPNVDDSNLNSIISKILAPMAAGGFIDCDIPKPTPEILEWVTDRVQVYEMAADGPSQALLSTDPLNYLAVVSPSANQGMPLKRVYYFLNEKEYGPLEGGHLEQAYRRFEVYRDQELFRLFQYERSFPQHYERIADQYHLRFV
ncbi:MAG: helix-turn-helix transcriptional regulator [Verrucomicrobiota bacterium]